MRILMSALQPGGGIRTFFRYMYGHPVFEDCVFTLVAPDQDLGSYLAEHLPMGRITLVRADRGHREFISSMRKLAREGDFSLVHSHGFSSGLLTQVARTGLPTPHLMTAHDVFLPVQFEGFRGALKRWLMARLFRRMTGIHTVTTDARDNLLEFFPGIPRDNIHDILHGVDTCYFRDGTRQQLKDELNLPTNVPLVGFFGRFMGQKGFRLIVQSMKIIKEEGLLDPLPHVVTFGWGGYIREDYAYLEGLGLGDLFHQLPQTDDMAGALKGVDLVAMPSRWEACGLLAMEALAAGKAIVGSDCLGLREVLDGTPARQVPVGDVRALVDALVFEISNLDSREGDFLAYQATAVSRFHIDRPARSLRELYGLYEKN